MNYNKDIIEPFMNAADSEERRRLYTQGLDILYKEHQSRISSWLIYETMVNRIKTHTLTYDDPEANEIRVAFYQTICYQNLINKNYSKNQYAKFGIKNFFVNIINIVGPIRFISIDDLNKYKIFILNNTSDIIKYTSDLFQDLYRYTSSDDLSYKARLDWFESVTSTVESIVYTVEEAIKSFLPVTTDGDINKLNLAKSRDIGGIELNEIPTEVSTRREDND